MKENVYCFLNIILIVSQVIWYIILKNSSKQDHLKYEKLCKHLGWNPDLTEIHCKTCIDFSGGQVFTFELKSPCPSSACAWTNNALSIMRFCYLLKNGNLKLIFLLSNCTSFFPSKFIFFNGYFILIMLITTAQVRYARSQCPLRKYYEQF